jgi:hypothetical protein
VIGNVVGYGRKEVTIQRRRGRVYVNEHPLSNLPHVCQATLAKIVAHFDKVPIDGATGLEEWALKQKGEPRTFTWDGVTLELENGEEYPIPFFLFTGEEMNVLRPGWERWLAAEKDNAQREHESLLAQSQAQAYQQDRRASRQIAVMQLEMQAYGAGLFDLWEVRLLPAPGVPRQPLLVVVPARDSQSAVAEALRRNPGFVADAVCEVTRTF